MCNCFIIAFAIVFTVFSKGYAQWTDDFESYTANSWPSTWIADANATDISTNYVDNTVAYQGTKSLQIFGSIGGCWAALAYHPVAMNPPFEIEFAVRNGDELLSGCHPDRATIGLRKGTSWANPSRNLLNFSRNDTLLSGGGGVSLGTGTYSTLTWYTVKIRYERPSTSTVKLSYWINGIYKGNETLTAIADEDQLTNFDVDAQEGTVWIDDVKINELPPSSINENELSNLIIIHPNPTTGKFVIEMNIKKVTDLEIKLLNVIGQVIYQEKLNKYVGEYQKAIDLGKHAKGAYNLQFISDEEIINKKIVVE